MKPKENKGYTPGIYDECQTPPYALEPLLPYLKKEWAIWECAVGKGTLIKALTQNGYYATYGTDINQSVPINFLERISIDVDVIVTNPPYSIKYEWLKRCYELDRPFALLMPVEMLGTARGQFLFNTYGIEIIFVSPRVDFSMPDMLWSGNGAQFPVAWYTWKLNLPKQINFAVLNKPKKSELADYWFKSLDLSGEIDLTTSWIEINSKVPLKDAMKSANQKAQKSVSAWRNFVIVRHAIENDNNIRVRCRYWIKQDV